MNPSTICCLHPVLHTNRQLSLSNFTTLLALAVLFSLLLFISITLSSFPSPLPLCSLSVLGWLSLSSPSADSLPRLQSLLYGRASLPRHMRGLQKSLSASFCILARFSHQPSFRTCTPILAFLFAIHAVSGSQLQRQEQLLKIIRIDPPGTPHHDLPKRALCSALTWPMELSGGPLAGGTTVTVIGSGFTGSFTAASSHALCKFGDVQVSHLCGNASMDSGAPHVLRSRLVVPDCAVVSHSFSHDLHQPTVSACQPRRGVIPGLE